MASRQREGTKIEDHLLKKGEERKKRKEDAENVRQQPSMMVQVRKPTDKYLLQKFFKQFDAAINFIMADKHHTPNEGSSSALEI